MSSNSKFAVVTGASGIGLALARVFAKNGYDLLITAENPELEQAAIQLRSLGTQVQAIKADLTKYEEVERLWSAVQGSSRLLDVVAINAGVGVGGKFAETDLDKELNIVQLNVTSTVHLAKRVVREMLARRSGRILFTSSIAGTMPTPLEAVYGASKAFVLSFAKSLRYELQDEGITVTALQPGPTDTEFFHRAGMDDTKLGQEGKYENDPDEVAQQAYDALMAGEDHVYAASMKVKAEGELGKFIPESVKAKMHKKQAERKTGT
jgi:short-subunit dehydrogenase